MYWYYKWSWDIFEKVLLCWLISGIGCRKFCTCVVLEVQNRKLCPQQAQDKWTSDWQGCSKNYSPPPSECARRTSSESFSAPFVNVATQYHVTWTTAIKSDDISHKDLPRFASHLKGIESRPVPLGNGHFSSSEVDNSLRMNFYSCPVASVNATSSS